MNNKKNRFICLAVILILCNLLIGCGDIGSKTIEPKEEILQSTFSDMIFQVDDLVIDYSTPMSFNDFSVLFPEDYVWVDSSTMEEVNVEKLLTYQEEVEIYLCYKNTNYRKRTSGLVVYTKNISEDTMQLKDCLVVEIIRNPIGDANVYFTKGMGRNDSERFPNLTFDGIDSFLEENDVIMGSDEKAPSISYFSPLSRYKEGRMYTVLAHGQSLCGVYPSYSNKTVAAKSKDGLTYVIYSISVSTTETEQYGRKCRVLKKCVISIDAETGLARTEHGIIVDVRGVYTLPGHIEP